MGKGQGVPVQVLAEGRAEFGTAELGEQGDGLLDVGNRAARQTSAAEGGRGEPLNQGV